MIGALLNLVFWMVVHFRWSNWGKHSRLYPTVALKSPGIAVVIPARNEIANIKSCLSAVLACDGVRQVIVVDDGSTDGTTEEARLIGAHDPRFKLISAGLRPDGWAGKNYACWTGAKETQAEWIAFVDADVRLHPGSLDALIQRASADQASLVSMFGTWERKGFWERCLIPAIGWMIRGAADPDRLNRGQRSGPFRAFANGQCLLTAAVAYRELGGHSAVAASVLDDVRLAEHFFDNGKKVGLYVAPWAFQVRLYDGFSAIWNGYRKNLYSGVGRRLGLALAASIGVFLAVVAPFILGAEAYWRGATMDAIAWGMAVVAAISLRARIERFDGYSLGNALSHPIAGVVISALWIATIIPGATWRGRRFDGERAR